MGNVIVYDLETKKTFGEIGGQDRKNIHLLGISLAGVYSYTDDTYYAFREQELHKFEEMLKNCELLIGFNSRYFDNPVLQPYLQTVDVSKIPHLDMLEVIQEELGFRVKLDNLASTTLAEGKSGSGLDAIRYYRLGQWDALEKYCLDDVRVTRDVYEYGRTHGYVWYLESGQPTKVAITWGEDELVDDVLDRAITEHRQVDIEYIQVTGTGSQAQTSRYETKLDIRHIDSGKITAFSHADQKEKIFDQAKVFRAKLNGKTSAHQQSLI